eukprot:CAMPEP_0171762454 /NCGR_PEP_ID=MMETSP0991-20121206/48662_1 /TAXON_ID=483369 /ORGANISM="non described non described, Strain CCMP2098" /LENGTH=71 /DNA_ID=CAMNT_0012365913 /DNA_START=429 /DNA_END=646 /DNA_ORIENTATION=+
MTGHIPEIDGEIELEYLVEHFSKHSPTLVADMLQSSNASVLIFPQPMTSTIEPTVGSPLEVSAKAEPVLPR